VTCSSTASGPVEFSAPSGMSTALLRDADILASLTFKLPQLGLSHRWRRRQRRQSAHVPIVMVFGAAFAKGPNVQSIDPLDGNDADTSSIRKRYYMCVSPKYLRSEAIGTSLDSTRSLDPSRLRHLNYQVTLACAPWIDWLRGA
jgi:hypothetical protein